MEHNTEPTLIEARDLLKKVALILEDAGWIGFATEIAEMADAVGALRSRGPHRQLSALSSAQITRE